MSQQHLITALKSSATACHFPITFLISSRPEVHLVVTFNQDDVKKAVVSTGLDHSYSPQDDIRLFLEGTFADIKQKHPLRGYLPPDWPSSEAVNTLVRKSSGQFIYAATVARYVSPPDVHPIERLDIVLGVTPSIGHESPFAELDALYFHILSSLPNSNKAAAMRIIALLVYPKRREYWTAEKFDSFLELRSGSSQQILGRLASIVDSGSHIRILHASIADFLFDAARSLKFFIDLPTQSTQFCRLCLRHFVSGTDYSPFRHALDNIARYCQNAAMSEELWNELVRFPDQGSLVYSKCCQAVCDFVKAEITLHYRSTSPLLATLLVLYALDPIPVLGHSKIQIDAQLHGQSHSVNFVDFLLVPTQHHEFESLLEIDDSSLQLTSITAEDRCRYSLLFGPNYERSFKPSYEITEKDEVIMTLKQEAYAAALTYLLVLLPDTRADPELSDLLRSADIQWESRDPATLRPRVEAAIDNYLLRSESMIGGANNSQSSEQFDSTPWRLRTEAQQVLSPSREFSDFPVFHPGVFQRPFRTSLPHREPEGDPEGEKEPNSCTSGENGKAGSHDGIGNTAIPQDVQPLLEEDREEVHTDDPEPQSFKASVKAWLKTHLKKFQRRLPGLRPVERGLSHMVVKLWVYITLGACATILESDLWLSAGIYNVNASFAFSKSTRTTFVCW
ncbi:hypothetical protein NLJ89_g2921 [Agrocybe chaxingu]|uniref:Uncharacterized protein n=1 Tax=Agrocybe chaxingu TaxID=84603 RepID=A0A9W8K5N5_9AGAR|nr:hypothetical protein NLJ89_g2921 [Agrocybe chaxingu]